MSKDRTTVHIHGYHFSGQFYILVIHFAVAIQVGHTILCKHNGVISFINNRSIQRLLLLGRLQLNRIVLQCISSQQGISLLHTSYIKGISPFDSCRNSPSTPTLRKSLVRDQE